jgi:uncharacterized repeat protein (TIGR01451 family)
MALPVAAQTPAGVEIVNVAKGRYTPSGGDPGLAPPEPEEVDSNPVVTRVIGDHCFLPPILNVEPAGTIAPGAAVRYRLTLANANGATLRDIRVEMRLHAGLARPTSFTDGSVAKSGGGSTGCSGTYDPATHTLAWRIGVLDPGDSVVLDLSTAALPELPADFTIEQFGEVLSADCPDAVRSNLVVTQVVPPVLEITKQADRSTVTVGDGVVYTFRIRHAGTDPPLEQVVLVDELPEVLRYAEGSARLDGEIVSDPAITQDGRTLRLPLGSMQPGDARTVRLAALVGPVAEQGEAINEARAEATTAGGAPIVSPPAHASVVVQPGPFRREAYLVGRVFVDDDGDSAPDESEPGVPGVLVMLESGRGAITDVTGRWHIDGVRPGLHVLRADPGTIPATLVPVAGGVEWAGDRMSRFVEARASTLVVADLPLGPAGTPRCSIEAGGRKLLLPFDSLFDAQRNIPPRTEMFIDAISRWLADSAPVSRARPTVACTNGDPATGRAAEELSERIGQRLAERLAASRERGGDVAGRRPPSATPGEDESGGFEHVLRTAAPRAAILSPRDLSRAEDSRIDIEVLYPLGTRPHLMLNGHLVDPGRIGVSSELESRRIAAARYVGVPLTEGGNRLEFRAVPPGSDPASLRPEIATVMMPDLPVELRVNVPGEHWIADGVTPGTLQIEAVDGAGVRSPVKLVVTLHTERAVPLTPDLAPETEGHQLRLRDGAAEVRFAPLTVPGRVRVVARAEVMELERFVEVRPGAGTWRVTGLVEGNLAGDGGVEGDGGMAPGLDDGIASGTGGRVAAFARGPVGKASRLTLSLDTTRQRDRNRLENDFSPEQFYPVAGDASVGTDEAATQGKLFARLDGPRGFVQWGDFSTAFDRTELARYDRRMTGATGKVTTGRVAFEGFASSSDQEVVRDVFAPDGTSGPFLLTRSPVVARSETVLIEVRDRFQTDKVLSRQVKNRDIEYRLDPVAGTLLFAAPIAPFDPDLNPLRVVVLYESRDGGDDRITAGGRVSVQAGERLQLGATAVVDERAGENLLLYGADVAWRPVPGTVVEGEVATSDEQVSSTAVRLEILSRPSRNLAWEVHYRDLPANFDNPTYLGEPELGSLRYGGSVEWRPDQNWRVKGEAFFQQDEVLDMERRVAGVDAERRFGPVTAVAGLKSVDARSGIVGDASSQLVKAGVRAPMGKRWSGELLHEQALGDETAPGYPTRTSAGLAWQISDTLRAFLRQEFESGGSLNRDRTVLGLESRLGKHTKALFNYSLDGTASGYALRSLSGVETVLPVGRRSSVTLSAARLQTDHGEDGLDYTSLAGSYAYQAGSHLFSTRYELRLGSRDDRHLLTAAGAVKPREAWTVFARERLSLSVPRTAASAWRAEGLFGAAFRPRAGRWRMLARLDHSTSGGVPTTAGGVGAGTAGSEPAYSVSNPTPAFVLPGLGVGAGRSLAGQDWFAVSFAAGARVKPRQRLAATLTLRHADDDPLAGLPSTLAHLLSLHYTAQVHRRWTLGGSLRRFSQRESGLTSYGQGVEVGYLAFRNCWITGGYNFTGLEDANFPGADNRADGPFLSLRLKFDERNLLPWQDLRLDR